MHIQPFVNLKEKKNTSGVGGHWFVPIKKWVKYRKGSNNI